VVDLASHKVYLMKRWEIGSTDRWGPDGSGDDMHVTHIDVPNGQQTIKRGVADHEGQEPVGGNQSVEDARGEPARRRLVAAATPQWEPRL